MSTSPQAVLLDKLRSTLAFQPLGEPAGNLTLGRGALEGRPVRIAIVENRVASGALGEVEGERLGALFRIVARERTPLLLYLDSAGAKVSEGLKALGSFRALFKAGLEAAMSGAPVAAVLGKNCYGGSSMLAHLASHRLFGPGTQLAMSGPAIIASGAGMNVLDETFRAMAEASISAASRAKASEANTSWRPDLSLEGWLRSAFAPTPKPHGALYARHRALAQRLPDSARAAPAWEAVRRRDVEYLFPGGHDIREAHGFLSGEGRDAEGAVPVIGLVGKAPVGADRAYRFASAAWKLAAARPARVRVLLDCATHSPRLDDERIVLSEYIVDMSVALAELAARGAKIELTILGAAGGGVYVALAAAAHEVNTVHGATIQVLPGAAIAAILGEDKDGVPDPAEYAAAGVADRELRIGLPPKP